MKALAKRQESSRIYTLNLRKSVKFTTSVYARGVNFEFTQITQKFTQRFTQLNLHPVTLYAQSRKFQCAQICVNQRFAQIYAKKCADHTIYAEMPAIRVNIYALHISI